MEQEKGYIEIRVENIDKSLSPSDVDISELKDIISGIENFLHPTRKEKSSRPPISYSVESGSVKHRFLTAVTSVILFNRLTSEITKQNSLSFLNYKQQEVIEKFQDKARQKGYTILFNNSLTNETTLRITPETNYHTVISDVYESEFYLYGEIFQEGGKEPNLHIQTKEYGNLVVDATKEQIMEGDKKTYKIYGIKVRGKKNYKDNTITDLTLISFIKYNPVFNKERFDEIKQKASVNLNKIKDTDEHVKLVKGEWIV